MYSLLLCLKTNSWIIHPINIKKYLDDNYKLFINAIYKLLFSACVYMNHEVDFIKL